MLRGSLVAVVTPMHADGQIDRASLTRLLEWHIAEGTDAIVAVGTTGESATLNPAEHIAVIKQVVDDVDQRIPVIAGTGANSTQEAIELTAAAAKAGADACLLVTPYYNKPTQEGLYLHFKAVAEAVAIPQIVYNVPGRTSCDMSAETVLRLASVPNIIGVKEATGDLARAEQIISQTADDFLFFSGDDESACQSMLLGGDGVISVTSNVAPKAMHAMCEAAIAGDKTQALALDKTLQGLHTHLFVESSPIPVKWALQQMGLIEEGIRLPLTPLSASCYDTVQQALQQAGIQL